MVLNKREQLAPEDREKLKLLLTQASPIEVYEIVHEIWDEEQMLVLFNELREWVKQ